MYSCRRSQLKFAIFKLAFWARFIWPSQRSNFFSRTLPAMTFDFQKRFWTCPPQNREKSDPSSSMESTEFNNMLLSEVMAGKVHEKKFDLWPMTLMGQINQAQNANLKMANFSWDLFCRSQEIYYSRWSDHWAVVNILIPTGDKSVRKLCVQ